MKFCKKTLLRGALLLGCILLFLIGWQSGILEQLQDPEAIRDGGWKSCLFFVCAFILLGAVGVPPMLMILPIGEVWPFATAILMSLAGGMGASLVGFWISRYIARDSLYPKIPPKLMQYEKRMETHGFSTVIVLRLMFFLFPPVNWMLGISQIRVRSFLAGTLLGCIPGTIVFVKTGDGLPGFLLSQPPHIIAALVVAFLVMVAIWWKVILPK